MTSVPVLFKHKSIERRIVSALEQVPTLFTLRKIRALPNGGSNEFLSADPIRVRLRLFSRTRLIREALASANTDAIRRRPKFNFAGLRSIP